MSNFPFTKDGFYWRSAQVIQYDIQSKWTDPKYLIIYRFFSNDKIDSISSKELNRNLVNYFYI